MAHRRRHPVAAPWEPFAGRTDGTQFLRGQIPLGRYSLAACRGPPLAGRGRRGRNRWRRARRRPARADHRRRHRVPLPCQHQARRSGRRAAGGAARRRRGHGSGRGHHRGAADHDARGSATTRRSRSLFMDDLSFTEVECTIVATGSDPDGWLSLTFEPPTDDADRVLVRLGQPDAGRQRRRLASPRGRRPARSPRPARSSGRAGAWPTTTTGGSASGRATAASGRSTRPGRPGTTTTSAPTSSSSCAVSPGPSRSSA